MRGRWRSNFEHADPARARDLAYGLGRRVPAKSANRTAATMRIPKIQ
jgi:hypothetical protein